jgi:hypothetical protein
MAKVVSGNETKFPVGTRGQNKTAFPKREARLEVPARL